MVKFKQTRGLEACMQVSHSSTVISLSGACTQSYPISASHHDHLGKTLLQG